MHVLAVIFSKSYYFSFICQYIFSWLISSGREICPLLIYPSKSFIFELKTKIWAQVRDWPCKNNAFAGSQRGDSGGFSANQSKLWRHGEHSYTKVSVKYLQAHIALSKSKGTQTSKTNSSIYRCFLIQISLQSEKTSCLFLLYYRAIIIPVCTFEAIIGRILWSWFLLLITNISLPAITVNRFTSWEEPGAKIISLPREQK